MAEWERDTVYGFYRKLIFFERARGETLHSCTNLQIIASHPDVDLLRPSRGQLLRSGIII